MITIDLKYEIQKKLITNIKKIKIVILHHLKLFNTI